jgi:hypothetical protein
MRIFSCLRCEKCCYFDDEEKGPLLFSDEVKRLSLIARARGVELRIREVKDLGMYRWLIRGFCPFYDLARRSCTIHAVKPLSCRMYPLLYNPVSGEVVISRECPWVEENVDAGLDLGNFPDEAASLMEVARRLGPRRPRS